jgi:hypothetical protein
MLPALNAYVSPLLGYDLTSGRLGADISVEPAPPLLAATANVKLRGVEVQQTGVDVILVAHPGLVLIALPQIAVEDLAAVGDQAKALAEARSAAVRAALTGADANPRLPAERVTLIRGSRQTVPPVEQPVVRQLQDQP